MWKIWTYGATHDLTAMYGIGGHPPERGIVRWRDQWTTVDYPPGTLYALAAAGRLYRAFDPPFRNTVGLTVTIKLFILAADALTCLFLFTLVRWRYGDDLARCAALFYWLNPGVILDGAVLGYLDSWTAAPAIAAIAAADAGAPVVCGAAIALAMAMKLQAILLAPVAILVLWNRARVRAVIVASGSGLALACLLVAPFALRGALPNLLQGVSRLFTHDMLSATAANVWWIVSWLLRAADEVHAVGRLAASRIIVKILPISSFIALGYPNPRPIGTLAAAAAMAWAFWRARRAPTPVVLAAGAFAVHAYFVLAVQVHENHLYLALPLLAGAAALLPRLRGPFLLVSAIFVLNLVLFYGLGRGFPLPPRGVTFIDATVLLSAINVGALAWHASRFADTARATYESSGRYDRASPA